MHVSPFRAFVTLLMIVAGGLLIAPLVAKLPLLGWDWYYFFTAHNPDYNIYSSRSAYPPFTHYVIETFTWLPWRESFSILEGITLMSVAVGTWQAGGRYGAILLAMFSAPLWMLLWVGHPDGLALAGVVSGVFPLVLIKPQVACWSLLANRRLLIASLIFILITAVIWPLWPLNLGNATIGHEIDIGWASNSLVVALVGLGLLVGAGTNPWRLMAAGSLLSPYLMPFHLAVLVPSIGAARGWRKFIILAASWVLFIGTGMARPVNLICLVYPLVVYGCLTNPRIYCENVGALVRLMQFYWQIWMVLSRQILRALS